MKIIQTTGFASKIQPISSLESPTQQYSKYKSKKRSFNLKALLEFHKTSPLEAFKIPL